MMRWICGSFVCDDCEVRDVKDQLAFRRGKHAEIGEVGVAAELDVQARGRGRAEIVGHDGCRAAQKGKGRGEHPLVAQWNQVWPPVGVLRPEEFHWVGTIRRRLPKALRRSWK